MTGTDITERKRAEADREKFVALVESSRDFIGMCDLNGIPFFVNRAGPGDGRLGYARASASDADSRVLLPRGSTQDSRVVLSVRSGEGAWRNRGAVSALQDGRGSLDGLQGADADR
jgi:hypothetical protein